MTTHNGNKVIRSLGFIRFEEALFYFKGVRLSIIKTHKTSKSKSVVSRQNIKFNLKMRNYLSLFLLGIILVATSCSKDDDIDTIPPEKVTGITAEALNSAVLLKWINPTDEDFLLTKITYGETIVEVSAEKNEKRIENLINGTEYTFELYSVDREGNISEPITVAATPDKYVTIVQGNDIVNGTFDRLNSSFPIEIVFNNSSCVQTMEAGGTKYIWEGTWSFENDTTYKFDCEYYTDDFQGVTHVANIVKRRTPTFNYDYSDSTFYVEKAYLKIDGDEGLLQGTYKSYMKDISDDAPSYSDTTFFYANVSQDGNIEYSDSDGNTDSGDWDNQDLLDGNFLFVTYKDESYLVIREKSILYNKR